MKQKVFVIGNSFATRLGIIRSLSQVDCEIFVIAIAYWKGKYIKPEIFKIMCKYRCGGAACPEQ